MECSACSPPLSGQFNPYLPLPELTSLLLVNSFLAVRRQTPPTLSEWDPAAGHPNTLTKSALALPCICLCFLVTVLTVNA